MLPLDKDDDEDAISLRKILKKEGTFSVNENVLGFDVDSNLVQNTILLT